MLQMQQLTSCADSRIHLLLKKLDGLVVGDEQPIGPIVKYVWKVALHVLHNCCQVTSLAKYGKSSPSTKELDGLASRKWA